MDHHKGGAVRLAWVLSLAVVAGCGLSSSHGLGPSVGAANAGYLRAGQPLPDRGEHFVRAKPGEDTRWATPLLLAAIARASSAVAEAFPGAPPLVVGDISAAGGGRHVKHGSHRTGRDVDVMFYLTSPNGEVSRGSGFFAFDRRGVSSAGEAAAGPNAGLRMLDLARNWAFVRALLTDPEAPVQWIFCAAGIKARLLLYALDHEPDAELLLRASYVLHQPSQGNPHDDHFHVRIACTAEEQARGCVERGPVWPWLRNAHEKPVWEGIVRSDDVTLLHALLDEEQGG